MQTLAAAIALLAIQTIPEPRPVVSLGQPPAFFTERGAEDIAFSPDGQKLAAVAFAEGKRRVIVYDTASGKTLFRTAPLTGKGTVRMAWARRTPRIVTASQGVVAVWDATDGRRLQRRVLGPLMSQQVDRILVSERAELAVYIPRTGDTSVTLSLAEPNADIDVVPYRKEIQGFDGMGRLLVSDGDNARLIDPRTSRPLQTCAAGRTTGVIDASSGTQAWLRGELWVRKLDHLARCRPSRWRPLKPGKSWRRVAFGAGARVIAASNDRSVKVWTRDGRLRHSYQGATPLLRTEQRLQVSSNGDYVAVAGRRLGVLRLSDRRWVSLPNDVHEPTDVSISADGKVFGVADARRGARIFDRRTGELSAALGPARHLTLDARGDRVLLLADGTLSAVRLRDGQVSWSQPVKATHLWVSRDRTTVGLSSLHDGTVRIFKWERGHPKMTAISLRGGSAWSSSMAFDSSGDQVLVTHGKTHQLVLFKSGPTGWDPTATLDFRARGGLARALFASEGTIVSMAAFRKQANLTSVGERATRRLASHPVYFSAASGLEDGMLVMGDERGRVGIYDTRTRRLAVSWKGHFGRVTALSASSDGRWLVSAGEGGRVKVWPVGNRISAVTAQR